MRSIKEIVTLMEYNAELGTEKESVTIPGVALIAIAALLVSRD